MTMGRGRNGLTEQSQRKPKRLARSENAVVFNKPRGGDGGIFYLSEKMIAEMKQLNPRDVANILLKGDGND